MVLIGWSRHFECQAAFGVCRCRQTEIGKMKNPRNESNHIHFVNWLVSVSHSPCHMWKRNS